MNISHFYINGEWVTPDGKEHIEVINPSTNEIIGSLPQANAVDVENAIKSAKNAFEAFSKTSVDERLEYLKKINTLLTDNNEKMAELISLEMGAPCGLSQNAQAPSGIQHFSEIINILERYKFTHQTEKGTLVTQVPIGVCVLITPWNWPINQIATKLAPAIAAGCTVVLKPSECAPLSALFLAELIQQSGLPKGVFNLINGTGESIGEQLTSHKDVNMVSFTGSTKAGVAISKNAASSIKRVSLELGGKSAGIVSGEINIPKVAEQILDSSMTNTGQSCNALTRLFIDEKNYDELVDELSIQAQQLRVGTPYSDVEIGPLANKNQYRKVREYIQRGINEGATLITGGLSSCESVANGFFVLPTLFGDVKPSMTIAKEEIFGPVLSIFKYTDLNEAIKEANNTDYGLSGYVWAKNLTQASKIAQELRTGMVHLNGAGLDSSAPFGGFKMSGNGREWGIYGLHEFLEYKSMYGATE